ncbi:hypothetical protein BASA50_010666 [Batrachochytrium salamandrivorans]|uniref:Uncharacterized protein n=1 Tax=Batrachochytrium salamandrivorans TaxID=1357716 RepID=A0ABQ8F0Q7_9FUNG|nr:hypothetical protein BASA50_010666 [Batrachochytrium salamandrivorans]
MPSTTTIPSRLKLDLDFQTTFHVVERGWSAGLASIYMSLLVPTVPFVPIVATVPVVATTFIVPLAATVSTAPVHSGAVVKYCKPSTTTIAAAVSTGSAVVKFIPLFPHLHPKCASGHFCLRCTIVSSEASAEAPIEVPTEAACSAVESAFSPAVAAQAMVSVPDCDVAASPLAPSTNLASAHSYDKPFWERSSRRKVVALPSLHMAMVDYNNWLITYDSRGSVVFPTTKGVELLDISSGWRVRLGRGYRWRLGLG